MNVILDALAARFGGAVYSVVQVARAMAARPDVERLYVVAEAGSTVARDLEHLPKAELVTVPGARGARIAIRTLWQATRLPRLVRRESADAVVTFTGMLPRHPGCAVFSHLGNPIPFEVPLVRHRVRRWAIARTTKRAAGVVVSSAGMAELVRAGTGREPRIVPLGVDQRLFTEAPTPGRDLLMVGDFYRHKRHDVAIRAWQALPEPRPRLRFIGNPAVDAAWFDEISRLAARSANDNSIEVRGRVPLAELVSGYHGARLLLMPSEHESFCMPIAEALACGVPAVVRDDPVLRETAGPAGVAVEGDEPERWAAAIRRLLEDDAEHAELRARGLEYAQRYSWARLADALLGN